MPGRRPIPTVLKVLRGNPGHGPINHDEPVPPSGEPEMPKVLSKAARRNWKRILAQIKEMGLATSVDGLILGATSEAQAIWERATKEIQERGVVVEEPVVVDGEVVGSKVKKNPACAIAAQFFMVMKSGLIEFGLTPASRSKIKVEKKPEDPLDKLMKRKGMHEIEELSNVPTPQPVGFDTGKVTEPELNDELTNFDA